MRFGILGCGVVSRAHAAAITALGESTLVAAFDLDPERARAFAAHHECRVEQNYVSLLERDDIDAVAVCLPSAAHSHMAVAALEAGKHVLVEKPIATSLDDADRIIEAERRSGKVVTTISQRRFDPAPRFVHHAVTEGVLGRLTYGVAESTWWRPQHYYDSATWRGTWLVDGGGALINQGIHQADMLLWMLGDPIEVSAFADTLVHPRLEVEDTIAGVIRFSNGAIGTTSATTSANPGLPLRLSVHGDRGGAVIEGNQLCSFDLAESDLNHTAAERLVRSEFVSRVAAVRAQFRGRDAPSHPAQYADFVEAVETGRPPAVSSADGRRALQLVLGFYESARSGKTVELGPA